MKIGYSKTYPITSNGTWEKIWVEHDSVGEMSEEEIRKHLYSLKRQVENFHYESNKSEEKKQNEINSIQNTNGKSKEDGIIEAISGCTTLKSLQIFSNFAAKYPKIQSAYEEKLKELSV